MYKESKCRYCGEENGNHFYGCYLVLRTFRKPNPIKKPNPINVLNYNFFMRNVGGHNFKGDYGQDYKHSWTRVEMDELVNKKQATRVPYGDMIWGYTVWMGKEEASKDEAIKFISKLRAIERYGQGEGI